MQVKEIIKLACSFTENEELVSDIEWNRLSADEMIVVDCLMNCFNLICDEIATDYVPCVKTQTFNTSSFKIYLNQFDKNVYKIISVKDSKGRNIKYKIVDDYIMVLADKVDVTYSYHPDKLNINSSFTSMIPERVYAYGIAREYYFMQTLFSDAETWESRFKNSLQVLTKKEGNVIMPGRSWI